MAAAKRRKPAPIGKRSIEELVDRLGAVKAELDVLGAEEQAIKTELTSREVSEAEGRVFRIVIASSMRTTLDTGRIKSEMGPAWVESHSRQSVTTRFVVSPRPDVLAAAAA